MLDMTDCGLIAEISSLTDNKLLAELIGVELVGAGGPPPHAFQMLQEENMQLRTRLQEMEKRVSDLTATNEFLLDQNAQLRMGVKPAASVSTPGVPVSGLAGWPGVDFS